MLNNWLQFEASRLRVHNNIMCNTRRKISCKSVKVPRLQVGQEEFIRFEGLD